MIRPKKYPFSLWRNFINSYHGFVEVTKNEMPMRAELLAFAVCTAVIIFLQLEFVYSAILFISLFLPIFAELINSAIERVVDLCTLEIHPLAKAAKDAGSAIVMIAIIMTVLIWLSVLYIVYFGGTKCF